MINTKTLLILGAGASMDYGFPSGRELLEDMHNFIKGKLHKTILGFGVNVNNGVEQYTAPIIVLAGVLCFEYNRIRNNKISFSDCIKITQKFVSLLFNSSTASIDDFLARIQHNKPENWEEYIFIGKVLIVFLISQYQQDRMFTYRGNAYKNEQYANHRYTKAKFTDSRNSTNVLHNTEEFICGWYDNLWIKLYEGCRTKEELKESLANLKVITFNYDLSLEYFLRTRISSMFSCDDNEVRDIFNKLQIHHVYGSLTSYSQINTGVFNDLFQRVLKNDLNPDLVLEEFGSVIGTLGSTRRAEDVYKNTEEALARVCNIAKGIFTYEETKEIKKLEISFEMKEELTKVEDVFFLGFGYLKQNMDFLQKNVFVHTNPNYFGTMYGIGRNSMLNILNMIRSLSAGTASWLGYNISIPLNIDYINQGSEMVFFKKYPEFNKMKISEFFNEVRSIN